jgi:hypothetical protein
MTPQRPESGPNRPDTSSPGPLVIPAAKVPEPKPPPPPAALGALLLGALVVAVAAFALAGILITVGVFVIPALVIASILYFIWSAQRKVARREAPRKTPR